MRKLIVELLFAERNHVCAVCVMDGACELQDLAAQLGRGSYPADAAVSALRPWT